MEDDNDQLEMLAMLAGLSYAAIDRLMDALERGEITPEEWQRAMEVLLARHHTAAYMAGADMADLTPEDMRTLTETLQVQLGFLDAFAATMTPTLFESRWRARARMYGEAIDQSFWRGLARGMPALPAYPRDGSTYCRTRCYCRWQIEVLDADRGDYNATWVLGAAEHCPHCIARAKAWSPLRIRGGIVDMGQVVAGGLFR